MPTRPTVKIQTVWRDRDGGEAQLQLYLPFSSTREQAVSGAITAISLVQDISNAVCSGYKVIWEATIDEPVVAGPDSDVNRCAWLFYRNEANIYEAIRIPSVKTILVEEQGPFAGVRLVDKDASGGGPLLAMEAVASILETPEGEPFPGELVTAGVML